MTWFSRFLGAGSGSTSGRRTTPSPAATPDSLATAIGAAIAAAQLSPRSTLSFAEALELICRATGWPVGHVWTKGPTGWQTSGAWYDAGPQYAELKDCTADTDLGSGRGIVAAVLHLGACRFLPGLEGLGSPERKRLGAELGLTCVVGVPVHVAGRIVAILEFVTTEYVEPESSLAEALLDIAGRSRRRVVRHNVPVPPVRRVPAVPVDVPADLAG